MVDPALTEAWKCDATTVRAMARAERLHHSGRTGPVPYETLLAIAAIMRIEPEFTPEVPASAPPKSQLKKQNGGSH